MTTLTELQSLRAQGVTSTNQAVALLSIREGRKTLGEVANLLGISDAGTTVVADKLERLGLATRARDPRDRRIVYMEANRELSQPGTQITP